MQRRQLAADDFKQGFNCAQAVLAAFAGEFGLERTAALRVAAGLGGGIGRQGDLCGAVTGAVLVLGLKHGSVMPNDSAAKEATYAAVREFLQRFQERHQTLVCRELLGCDIGTPDGLQAARDQNLFATRCRGYVEDAVGLLERD